MDLRNVCDACGLYLFLDGARLAYGLAAGGTECDSSRSGGVDGCFYIGGTKVGALLENVWSLTIPP